MANLVDLMKYGHYAEKLRHTQNKEFTNLTNILRNREYRIIGKIGEGTFSEVVKAQSLQDGGYYACKKMKQRFESTEQVNNLREIQAMRRLSPHPNILQLHEVLHDRKTGSLSLICELMEMNVYELIRGRRDPLPENKIKSYMYQLCKSLDHMHRNGIFHRDVKPENILIRRDVLKLADFGSCRSVYSKPPYTEYISTRWYRAPECLLTDGHYSYKMDMWSAGCVFFEIVSLNPLFPGSNELDQISRIHDVLGTPDGAVLRKFKQSRAMRFDFPPKKGSGISRLIPRSSSESLSLMYEMLQYEPEERTSSKAALQHPYFKELRVAEKQAATLRRAIGAVQQGENSGTPNSIDNLWRIARQGRRPHHIKHVQEPLVRRHGPPYPLELPKLNVAAPKIPTYPMTSLTSVLSQNVTLPVLQPTKSNGKTNKPSKEHPLKPCLKTYHIPPLERKGGDL
ncbi:MAPK/MAK/MRK overlapping kinase-like isoform X1 [Acipenser ruthenus]|uniref:MAPK/MAK/MRK overlapping kinase-like isoform X1 n=1 Tax=Acipenser ruthenus TaxID=7906 RepID=UPI0027403E5E|nr:MAPK/MAK/MRK overlapping kinase-like isoform X1 [Acipenser ruthenus]